MLLLHSYLHDHPNVRILHRPILQPNMLPALIVDFESQDDRRVDVTGKPKQSLTYNNLIEVD